MEMHDFASEQEIRERNAKLVPVLLKKLKELQLQAEEERAREREERFKRPFALFSGSPNKRRPSKDGEEQKHHQSQQLAASGDKPVAVNGVNIWPIEDRWV